MSIEWISKLPKIELHAHLNGSLSLDSMIELAAFVYGENSPEYEEFKENSSSFQVVEDFNKCFEKFQLMHSLTATKEGLCKATELVIRDFARDSVIYLELRSTPKTTPAMSKLGYLRCILDSIMNSAEYRNKQIIVKLLPSIDRSKKAAEADEMLQVVLELRKEYKDIITGIDLSGNPNCGDLHHFMPVMAKARRNGLKLAVHCAEVDNPREIKEMLKFGMHRCGHGTFLTDEQLEELAKKNIGVECCLTSNVMCGTVSSYDEHHFKRMFQKEQCIGSVVLCTDDCGVFNTSLTQELVKAKETFGLQPQDLVRLQLNAVALAFTSESEKHEICEKIIEYFVKNTINW